MPLDITKEFVTYFHLIGFALGFGGALCSDVMFFSSIKDKFITKTEFRFITLGGKLVWLGLLIMFLSGIGLVYLKPALLGSSKFLIKMVVVSVIALNGFIMHRYYFPQIKAIIDKPLREVAFFKEKGYLLTISGAISVLSWFSATLLGSLPGLPFSFGQLLLLYLCLLLLAMLGGYIFQRYLLDI